MTDSRSLAGNPVTPDGRYVVVRGRLWRLANPQLSPAARDALVKQLVAARRAVGLAKRGGDADAVRVARAAVDAAKRALGERGEVWWTDGTPDLNRKLAANTPYADWFCDLKRDAAPAVTPAESARRLP